MLLSHTENILGEWWELQQKVKESKKTIGGTLRIAVFPTCLRYIMRDFLPIYLRNNEASELIVEEALTETVNEWVLGHQVEAGIVVAPLSHPRLRGYPLYIEKFGIVVSPGHPWYSLAEVQASELCRFPLIIPTLNRGYYRDFVMSTMAQHNVQLEPHLVVHNYEVTMVLACSGFGAALAPLVSFVQFKKLYKQCKFIRISPPLERKLMWVEREDRKRSPACEAFFFALVEFLQNNPSLTPLINLQDISE